MRHIPTDLAARIEAIPPVVPARQVAFLADDQNLLLSRFRDGVHREVSRELSVGVLDGAALGVVEIRPRSGVYDFASKYTKGATEYLAPAPLPDPAAAAVRAAAEKAFAACGCRDYARVDFILISPEEFYLLEINTLPGMKETSLLPMSARCAGLDFTGLVERLVGPAVRRLKETRPSTRP